MYGCLDNLDHIKSLKEEKGLSLMMGAALTKNNLLVSGSLLFTRRDSSILFSRMKKMSPKIKELGMELNSGNGGKREWATMKLSRIGEKATPLLSLTLTHGETMARAASAEAYCRMIRLGLTTGVSHLLPIAMHDEDPYVRWRTFAEISKMGSKSSCLIKHLFEGLHDQSDIVRVQAAKAIAATYRQPRRSYEEDISDLKELIVVEKDRYVRGEMSLALFKVEREEGHFNKKFLKGIGFKV